MRWIPGDPRDLVDEYFPTLTIFVAILAAVGMILLFGIVKGKP